MTTILADARLGVLVADSMISDGDRRYAGKKVFRWRGALIGMAGDVGTFADALSWLKGELAAPPTGVSALLLTHAGLEVWDHNAPHPVRVPAGREAIGSGAKAAMCAYEALGWTDPRRAVRIVCKHDAGSLGPVRVYRL